MAFTVAALYTTKTLTAAAEVNSSYAKFDLNAYAFNGITFEIKLTNGTIPPVAGRQVKISYAFSSQSLDVNTQNIAAILTPSAGVFSAPTNNTASGIVGSISAPVPAVARYLYVWVNHDTLGAPVTLDASYIGYNFGAPAA